ncbi:MAG TPA: bifunctional ADP-heptose synthase [Bacteroidales bacterium]|nr:bifunctional ADP-heptose synthase [Bacteroidales bacterium]
MKNSELKSIFEAFTDFRIMVIGDVMIDSYLWGKVDRISPEAPVPIVTSQKQENRLGGAANVALNIQALGATPLLCSVTGNDERRQLLLDLMDNQGMTTEGIVYDDSRITTTKTRIISNSQQLLRVDREDDRYLSANIETEFLKRIELMLNKHQIDAIIFQDYDKGVITPAIIEKVVENSNARNIPTLVDPKRRNFTTYKNVTLFKPNFKEFNEGLKTETRKDNPASIFKESAVISTNWNVQYVMITLSEKGIFISKGDKYWTLPAEIRDIADVSGAGDTVISMASLCLAAGLGPEEIAWLSNIAGGLVCEKVGVVPVNRDLLLEECLALNNK